MNPLRPAQELRPDGKHFTIGKPIRTLWDDGAAGQAPPSHRFCHKASVFNGEGYVEQFLQEFHKAAVTSKWPAHVELLQLQSCLSGLATPYAVGLSTNHIFEALYVRFRLTVCDTRAHLKRRQKPRVPLQGHASKVKPLV